MQGSEADPPFPFQPRLASEFRPHADLSSQQLELLDRHFHLLTIWNQKLNLTRMLDPLEAIQLHYCESLFLGLCLPRGPLQVADLGSGAGFPGIPVAILRPELRVTLIESDARKAVFLREATRDLANVQVFAGRAEECHPTFDWVVSRAVAPCEVLRAKVAANLALLVSSPNAPSGAEVIRSPWGRDRIVALLREVSRGKVSRGTNGPIGP